MVKLSDNAKYMIIEGDEYLTSSIDKRPKFHIYKPDIALLSGIAWDHINVFPTYDNYVEQFKIFIDLITDKGTIVYCAEDKEVCKVIGATQKNIKKIPYSLPQYITEQGITYLINNGKKIPLQVFGKHNLLNINGAKYICNELGVSDKQFYESISSFKGASKRLELIAKNNNTAIFKDFAHSPSKLKASTKAVKEQFPARKLVACMELHTFSSLNKNFLKHYKNSMDEADIPVVYFNPHAIKLKKLSAITNNQVKDAFQTKNLKVFTDSSKMVDELLKINWDNKNLLMMSSGNFNGINLVKLTDKIIGQMSD